MLLLYFYTIFINCLQRKLKEYYYKCLREEKIKNKKCKKKEKGREKVDNLEKKETEKNEERGDTEDDLESKEKFDENKERGDNVYCVYHSCFCCRLNMSRR